MPSPITQSIAAAAGGLATSQVPQTQGKGNEATSVVANSPAQTRAAAEVSSTKAQNDTQRSIQRREARSEGSFSPQERPKESEADTREGDSESGGLRPKDGNPGRLNRVA